MRLLGNGRLLSYLFRKNFIKTSGIECLIGGVGYLNVYEVNVQESLSTDYIDSRDWFR